MQKSTPAEFSAMPSAKLPEQLALPLEESTPPRAEARDVLPRGVWETLEPKSRALARGRWAAVMREALRDARG